MIRRAGAVLLWVFAYAGPVKAQAPLAVRAWEGSLDLPTYEEGPPDVNPPFDILESRKFNYPYTLRENLSDRRVVAHWRTLNLENEHLRVTVLPDLGGHLYSCVDKSNGAEMFYANDSIKKARIAYRGAWTALGIEFNFPVSHNWVTASPVDHALRRHPDGSASLWVGNVDRVYGMQWRVALTLRPGRAVLEQEVALYNRSDTRHRFYWWNNAGVRVWDDSRIEYPMRFTASHGFRSTDTWPVNVQGVDLRVVGNHLYGPVSEFSHGSREPFMGVYHPRTRAGVVHYSSPLDAPTKKIWSWGGDADGLDWRKALSDDDSAYVEVQAGLFRNQETYAFLEPQETIRFTEYWMPVRDLGGITRANPDAVLHLAREPESAGTVALTLGLNVTRRVSGLLVLEDGSRTVRQEAIVATPKETLLRKFAGLPETPRYTIELRDAGGTVIRHTEDTYDFTPAEDIQVGPVPAAALPRAAERTLGDILALGRESELVGQRLRALDTYQEGLRRFPTALELQKSAGRLAVALHRFDEAAGLLREVVQQRTTDPEAQYYLGLAEAALARDREARAALEATLPFRSVRTAGLLALAQLEARAGRTSQALGRVQAATSSDPAAARAGALEIALLRHAGRLAQARRTLTTWRALDPVSSSLRYEAVLLGKPDEPLWSHFGEDPERVLDLASEYMAAGLYSDALSLLERTYPRTGGLRAEPGAVAPQEHPEVVYYRGFCRERTGGSGAADFAAGSKLSTRYVFPSRAQSRAVFESALRANPQDATAHFLLGSLLLSSGLADEAVREWQEARRIDPSLPVLHRNLGRTLLQVRGDTEGALAVFQEGMKTDPTNVDLYQGADQAMSLLGRPAGERLAALRRFPDLPAMPPGLVQRLALALAEDGRADEGEELLKGRFFPREEQGTNVRQVFVEIRLQKALGLARAGKQDACALVEALDREVPGLAFTKDGLGPFVQSPRVQYVAGEISSLCGDAAAARAHWTRAKESGATAMRGVPYASLASQRLGAVDAGAWRPRLEKALADAEVGEHETSFPGVVVHTQGLLLRELGREEEARARFRRALLLPDQRVSHFLSRRSLAGKDPF